MEKAPQRPPETVLPPEQQAEVERLQHGIAVLDLFDSEVKAEDKRSEFLRRTHPGTESREEILKGKAYSGDEAKLNNAINKAKRGYAITRIRLKAMEEHAAFLGIEAVIHGKYLVYANPKESYRVGKEHGKWRQNFASRYRSKERESQRESLNSRIRAITGGNVLETELVEKDKHGVPTVVVGPYVDLEERAVRLTHAINAMARRSMLSGFGIATSDEVYSEAVYEYYGDNTPRIDQAALNKRERLYKAAKRDFWVASGFPQIRSSGTMREFLLRRRSKKMWEEFEGQFEHSPQQKQRVKVRKQLAKYMREERVPETKIE